MKLRDKLKYLSNRALAAGTIISALLTLFACILILLANKEQAPWWCVGTVSGNLLVLAGTALFSVRTDDESLFGGVSLF